MARPIMIQGTMSGAGKTLLAAGLCRIFRQDGLRAAPFKSQNMALNSYITRDGLEMGRAQVMQAEAAGIEPAADMNPILLKPTSEMGSQVIVHGISRGVMSAREYFSIKKKLVPEILEAYARLDNAYDVIVIEGAGSPAEINLKQDDIVNMGLAELVDAPVLLAGDIDRGGVFAQLYGTVKLLEEKEQRRIRGLIINKFRGDPALLGSGIEMLEDLTGKKVAGVIPYLPVHLEDEDSLSDRLERHAERKAVDLAVIRFPRISNYTDFNIFETMEDVSVRYVSSPSHLDRPDLLFLPGTKNTSADMEWFRESGLESAVLRLHASGIPVFGICGGYQMMGEQITDLTGEEGCGTVRGMGLLKTKTVFEKEKVRARVTGTFEPVNGFFSALSGHPAEGYEIHMGRTVTESPAEPLCLLRDAGQKDAENRTRADGVFEDHAAGCYVHGVFDRGETAAALVNALKKKKGLAGEERPGDYRAYKEKQYDILADGIRNHMDMDLIYRILERKDI